MNTAEYTLDDWLGEISVMAVDDMDTRKEIGLGSVFDTWYAVVTEDGITAYFASEQSALRYRLAEINRRLNG
jgi:hypothetical protein